MRISDWSSDVCSSDLVHPRSRASCARVAPSLSLGRYAPREVEGGAHMSTVEDRWSAEAYCYLTTTGRTSGRPHEIEIWFAPLGDTIYLLNGSGEGVTAGQADWVKNIQANPAVRVRLGDEQLEGLGRAVEFDGGEHGREREP